MSGIKISMRRFSGLHAHMVVFMAITNIEDNVLLLSGKDGGHMDTKSILERIGLRVYECESDCKDTETDVQKAKGIMDKFKPKFIFVNSSVRLKYEKFSWLDEYEAMYKIYDASQNLSDIENDYINPFDMGFDAFTCTLGSQMVMFCTKTEDKYWSLFNSNISTYVSKPQIYSTELPKEAIGEFIKRVSGLSTWLRT